MYDDDGKLHVVGHTSGFSAKQKRELLGLLEPYRTGERGAGEPSRWKSEEELVWEGLRPELVVRDRLRPHHRRPDPPRREVPALARRQGSERVPYLAVAFLTLSRSLVPAQALPAAETRSGARRRSTRRACATRTACRSTARPATCYVGDVGGIQRGDHCTSRRPGPRRELRLELLLRDRQSGAAARPSGLRRAALRVPEQPGRGDRRLRGARPVAAVVRRAATCSPLQPGEMIDARPAARRRPPDATPASTSPNISGFGEDGVGHLYATSLRRRRSPARRRTRAGDARARRASAPFDQPVAVAAAPGEHRTSSSSRRSRGACVDGRRPARAASSTSATGSPIGGEQGLLSVAVAPDYATSGRLFVFYTDNGGDIQIDEVTRRRPAHPRADAPARPGRATTTAASCSSGRTMRSTSRPATAAPRAIRRQRPEPGLAAREDPADRCGRPAAAPPPPGATPAPTAPAPGRPCRAGSACCACAAPSAYARCSERCRSPRGGTLRIGSRRLLLRHAPSAARQPSPRTRLKVRLRKRSARLLRRALANGRRPRVRSGCAPAMLRATAQRWSARSLRVRR